MQSRKTGQYLVRKKFIPELILCSSAARARQTASLLAEEMGISPASVQQHNDLYQADVSTWMGFIRQLPPQVTTAVCVGHNPALSMLASVLSQRTVDLAPADFVVYESRTSSWTDFDNLIKELPTLLHR